MERRGNEITIRLVAPTLGQLESGRLAWSGVIVVGGERLARVTHDDRGTQYELFKVPHAAAKWARVERTAERTLAGAFAPVDEFVGMLWADAMEETSSPIPNTECRLSGTYFRFDAYRDPGSRFAVTLRCRVRHRRELALS